MKYKLAERVNPMQPTQRKWYATPVNDGKVDEDSIAAEIVQIASLARGDVNNVIMSLVDVIPKYLMMGKSVHLSELGTLRISFTSDGVDDPDSFNVSKIHGVRIVFTPSIKLKEAIQNMTFERES